jgi:hypothetical protein
MKYIVITSQLVGNEVSMDIEHYWDGRDFSDRGQAISHGFRLRGSDDFNIGMINKAGGLHSIWWMNERLHEPPETLRDIGKEIGLK